MKTYLVLDNIKSCKYSLIVIRAKSLKSANQIIKDNFASTSEEAITNIVEMKSDVYVHMNN